MCYYDVFIIRITQQYNNTFKEKMQELFLESNESVADE